MARTNALAGEFDRHNMDAAKKHTHKHILTFEVCFVCVGYRVSLEHSNRTLVGPTVHVLFCARLCSCVFICVCCSRVCANFVVFDRTVHAIHTQKNSKTLRLYCRPDRRLAGESFTTGHTRKHKKPTQLNKGSRVRIAHASDLHLIITHTPSPLPPSQQQQMQTNTIRARHAT